MSIATHLITLFEGGELTTAQMTQVQTVLDKYNVSLDEAVALNLWSENSYPFWNYMKNHNANAYIQKEVKRMDREVRLAGGNKELRANLRMFVYNLPDVHISELYTQARAMCPYVITTVLTSVRNVYIAKHVNTYLQHITNAIMRNSFDHPVTVYRATTQDLSNLIHNDGCTSTSKTLEASFIKYPKYTSIMEITIPAGMPCLDISEFSNYDDVEQEILLPSNIIYVDTITERDGKKYATCRASFADFDALREQRRAQVTTYMCKETFDAYSPLLDKDVPIYMGAYFISPSGGQPNANGLYLLHGVTADDDKKLYLSAENFAQYFEKISSCGITEVPKGSKLKLEAIY